MNLCQLYSHTLGQSIGKIHTYEKFFPLPSDTFILLQPFSKASKNYSLIDDVIELIHPVLEKQNIKIVQVGGRDERPLKNCYYVQGQTSWGQLEYLVSKSKLVLSVDSVSAHLAGHYNKPLVVLISNNFKECVSPYFGDKSKQIVFEPDRINKNPSFALDEGPVKQIDEIKPEKVASAVLQLLNIPFSYSYETVYVGLGYHVKSVETVPDHLINPAQLGVDSLIVRMDYKFSEQVLIEQLKLSKCIIITKQPINLQILQIFKSQIKEFIYAVDENSDPNYIKQIQSLGIPVVLITERQDDYPDLKFKFMDIGLIHKLDIPDVSKMKEFEGLDLNSLHYKSSKFILSEGKVYLSKVDWLNKQPVNNFDDNLRKVTNTPDFWKELKNFRILKYV